MVSLSDHDDIQAGWMLKVLEPQAPISVEWTIPFGPSFFHLGIHNLPQQRAAAAMRDLAAFTAAPSKNRLAELLTALDELREVLIVMNHPLWDEACIGAVEHARLAGRFLERFGERVHALELNGLRPWRENRRVAAWRTFGAATYSIPATAWPGSRMRLNSIHAADVASSSTSGAMVSDIVFMPQYLEPLRVRMIGTMCDIVRDYPDPPLARRRWNDRVFYRDDDGVVKPLSAHWQGNEPWPVKCFLGGLRALTSLLVRAALRFALPSAGGRRMIPGVLRSSPIPFLK